MYILFVATFFWTYLLGTHGVGRRPNPLVVDTLLWILWAADSSYSSRANSWLLRKDASRVVVVYYQVKEHHPSSRSAWEEQSGVLVSIRGWARGCHQSPLDSQWQSVWVPAAQLTHTHLSAHDHLAADRIAVTGFDHYSFAANAVNIYQGFAWGTKRQVPFFTG